MKIKETIKILICSILCLEGGSKGLAQEMLVRTHYAELYGERPALSCFAPSCAAVRFRNDFGMKELMCAEAEVIMAVRENRILMSVRHYGYGDYGDLQSDVGFGRNFGNRFAMTARLFYLMAHARGYPSRHSLSAEFAFACNVSPRLSFDVAVFNPFRLRYGIVGPTVIPIRFIAGCTYIPQRKLLLSFRMAKAFPGAWEVGCLFATQPLPPLFFALDCTNSQLGFRVGWSYRQFLFSVQAAWCYRIAVSPQIGIGFFPEKVFFTDLIK